ncbi:MAG: VCBS repeat-containing protein [Myxococcales bacterium]|nr:VCBS repeat-containing protein [Myxococcales bacterium]
MKVKTLRFTRSLLGLGLGTVLALSYVASCNNETTSGTDAGGTTADMTMTGGDVDMTTVAAPVVTQASPEAIGNTGGTTITLTGQNFVQGATVTIGGTAATNVMVTSPTTITLTVPGKAGTCGATQVVVTNPDGKSGSASNILRYRSNTFGFMPVASTATNSLNGPRNLVVADFTGDGKPDVLVSLLTPGMVSLLPGNGGSTFGTAMTTNVGQQPRAIAFANLDGDTKLDAVVTNSGSNTASVLIGTGTGTFTAKPTVATGNSPNAVVLRDFDGDTKLDMVVANPGGGTGMGSLTIALGNGDGTFKAPSSLTIPVGSTGIAAADLNGDGKLDLAISHGAQGTVSFVAGNGNGTFAAPASLSAGGATAKADDVVVGDIFQVSAMATAHRHGPTGAPARASGVSHCGPKHA